MKRVWLSVISLLFGSLPHVALAEGAGGSYRGIASLYYFFIAVILIYGVYDIFGGKVARIAGPLIAIATYFLIPDV